MHRQRRVYGTWTVKLHRKRKGRIEGKEENERKGERERKEGRGREEGEK